MGEGHRSRELPRRWLAGGVVGLLLAGTATAQLVGTGSTERISLSSSGTQSNGDSLSPAISADGRFVAFESAADNLVLGDTNGVSDIFVRDRLMGKTEIVSLSSREAGALANGPSHAPAISADGRFVAFASEADNLVPEDTNGVLNVFVRDRMLGKTELISQTLDGAPGTGGSGEPTISADGRFVAFVSFADNLVPDDTNGNKEIFVRDRMKGTTERVSLSSEGKPANGYSKKPSISADGRYLAFASDSTNLSLGDTNNGYDIFLRDRVAGKTESISISSAGTPGNNTSDDPSISADGRYVVFRSASDNLAPGHQTGPDEIFVRDRAARTTERVSSVRRSPAAFPDEPVARRCAISADGRYVAFVLSSLLPGDTQGRWQVFVYDRVAQLTDPVSLSSSGVPGNGPSLFPAISGDGRYVTFTSAADNLAPGDTNGRRDIFVRDLVARPAGLVVEPQTLAFGPIEVGTRQTRRLLLRNMGTSTFAGTVKALSEPFSILEAGDVTLTAGATLPLTVQFAPRSLGTFQAALVIASREPGGATVNVPLAGEGVGGGTGELMLSPRAALGLILRPTAREIVYGECTGTSLLLQNVGTGPLSGRVESLQAPFSVTGGGEFVLGPGENRTVVVQFCPPVGGLPMPLATTLVITSSDHGLPVEVPVRVQLP